MKRKNESLAKKLLLEKKQITNLSVINQDKGPLDGWTVDIPCLSHLPNSVCDDCLKKAALL